MARGRKAGPAVKVITSRDKELLKGLARTGVTTNYNAKQNIGLSEKRLSHLEKENYISSKNVVVNKGKDVIKVYYLENQGRNYIKNNSNIDICYRTNERQVVHDIKLSDVYYSLDRDTRDTWKNENVLIKEYNDKHPNKERKGMVDATVSIGGNSIAVEVITSNYKGEEIEGKYEMAEELGCKEVLRLDV